MPLLRVLVHGLLFLLGLVVTTFARGAELQNDPLGWRLQPFDLGVKRARGEPWNTQEADGLASLVSRVGDAGYFVITTDRQEPDRIHFLQFTGHDPGPDLVRGLHLGDPRGKVVAALGPPDRVRDIDITPVEGSGFGTR